jgi:hypothetical protein
MNPVSIDQWFPLEQQHKYVSLLKGRSNLTRRRAEYFVRLWAYLLLKQQQELGKPLQQPLTELEIPQGFVPCTHREAYELFYGHKDRGSERAAGMMIDKLVALGLIEKEFDGNTTCIRVRSLLTNLHKHNENEKFIELIPDAFNPQTDTIPVASFLCRNYNWKNNKTIALPHRIARILRTWSQAYPTSMRVLRRCDTEHPVGFYVLYPVATESEQNFFLPPSKSLHLSAVGDTDPIQIALPEEKSCTSVLIRSWQIDSPYKHRVNVCKFLEDTKNTLTRMRADFPNLCDMYVFPLHPFDEQLASAVGFQITSQDPQLLLYWMYTPIDKYLTLDIEQALSVMTFD